jgi:hypothetical protein
MEHPTLLINIFRFDGKLMPLEHHGVATTREEAVKNAEEFADEYEFTLSDTGKLDLSGDFSAEYWAARELSYARELKAGEAREARRTA